MTAFCPHCDSELGGHLVLTSDGHSFRSYWRREHGDVVPMGNDDDERLQSVLPDVVLIPSSSGQGFKVKRAIV